MKSYIKYKRFFAYSEEHNKSFHTKFGNNINIIYGKNTSGKSTLIQAINYTFGINDEKHKLSEVLDENVIFRLDFEIKREIIEKITIVRDTDFIVIRRKGYPLKKFLGINGNNSEEHKLLKKYLSELIGFNLFLESKGNYNIGSIESMFLPYYVAQDYGWVLALKSFRGLDYFRNFKFDYYDYYLGINNEYNREEKQRLETEKKILKNEIKFLCSTETEKDELQLSKLKDEAFLSKSAAYIEQYKEEKSTLIKKEKEYLILSNKIKLLEEHRKVLLSINRNIGKEKPHKDDCPTCNQSLPNSIEKIYEYYQNVDDTTKQIKANRNEIKVKVGSLNSLKKDINDLRVLINNKYSILKDYQIDNLSLNTWLDNKVNVHLSNKILSQVGKIEKELQGIIKKLAKFKTDDEIKNERKEKENDFSFNFQSNLRELKVKIFKDDYSLYNNKLFPQQGVELLKTLLAYYFSFNKIIKSTLYIHRLPFVMDAIFKEDIDEDNKSIILNFINKNQPKDTQVIFSLAESKKNHKTTIEYNRDHFSSKAKLIKINTLKKRAFLSEFNNKHEKIKRETLELIQ